VPSKRRKPISAPAIKASNTAGMTQLGHLWTLLMYHMYIVVKCNSPIPDLTRIYTIDHPLWHCNLHFACAVKVNSYNLSRLHRNNLVAVRGPYIHCVAFIAQYCICYRPNSYFAYISQEPSSYLSGTTIVPLIISCVV
jgi:hypothetical protein